MTLIHTDPVQRVLMTTDTVGGVWNYAVELTRSLSAEGIKVGLATMGARLREDQRSQLVSCPELELFESHFALEWMENPWEDVARAAEWLWELEQQFQPDVIHLNSYAHGSVPWSAPSLIVAHSCVLSWWEAVKAEPLPARWQAYTKAVRQGLQAVDCVVAPTHWMANEVCRHYGVARMPEVIWNGRSSKDYFCATKQPLVLSVGRIWDEAKNLQALAGIASQLSWRVGLVGNTRSPDGKEISLPGVELLGFLSPEVTAGYLARASLYVAPARYEPFGLSILEAALSGCALVLGDIPSLR